MTGSEPPADLMDNIETLTNPTQSFFSKSYSIGRLLWFTPGFLIRNSHKEGGERIAKVVQEFRQSRGVTKVAIQGYCWGGNIATCLGQRTDVVDVVCSAHPSGLKIPADIEKVVKPIAFVLADLDFELTAEHKRKIEASLASRQSPLPHEVRTFPGTSHGFAVRGDEAKEAVRLQRKEAFEMTVRFFRTHLHL